ncbi:unnamed protein product, partial [Iphiclides podalirius]
MREFGKFGPLIGTVDEGTSNVKFLVFAANTSEVLTFHQVSLNRFSPQEGWIEQDALEIFNAVLECIEVAVDNLKKLDIDPGDIVGIGITNQRETTIVWNSMTGEPLYSAIVWSDNLTGGCNGGVHATDVTNASRTQLMSLRSLQWDNRLLRFFDIPIQILPKIKSSSEIYGYISTGSLLGTPIAGCLGDQQAALIGQNCMSFGQAKCTFGTGCFLLYNTGESIVHSQNGLLTTVAFKLGPDAPPIYALEGSVAVAGDTLQWLQDGLEILNDISDSETQAAEVNDDEEGNICFVPAFNGLFSPYWKKDARGIICGLSGRTRSAHMVRAALEAVCQQTRALCDAMAADSAPLRRLLADGGAAQNSQLMQMQADIVGIPVIRPLMTESTALGAAIAAGRALGVWPSTTPSPPADTFIPAISSEEREVRRVRWEAALNRCMGWATGDSDQHKIETDEVDNTTAVLPPGLFFLGTALLVVIADKLKII